MRSSSSTPRPWPWRRSPHRTKSRSRPAQGSATWCCTAATSRPCSTSTATGSACASPTTIHVGREVSYFLRCNRRHHSLALVAGKDRYTLQHIMFEVDTVDAVGAAFERSCDLGVAQSTLGRHSNDEMFSFYALAPRRPTPSNTGVPGVSSTTTATRGPPIPQRVGGATATSGPVDDGDTDDLDPGVLDRGRSRRRRDAASSWAVTSLPSSMWTASSSPPTTCAPTGSRRSQRDTWNQTAPSSA